MNERSVCVSVCSCVVVTGVTAAWNRKSVKQNNNNYSHDLLHPTPPSGVCDGTEKEKTGKVQAIHHPHTHWDVL